ncbi:MAG TPA: FHA domain-containing protein [Bacteroidales bacterium]|nr:FHA domain-containing protein [Bacteroidales bacterium]
MFQIICPNCSNTNLFEKAESRPAECSFCFTTFDDTVVSEEVTDESKGTLCGLKLIYQQNSGTIVIDGPYCILGRENTGSQLLSGIIVNGKNVISRKHCSVKLVDGQYYLKDEGSLNGTFYGVNKIDCSKEPQRIENNSILFLGKEAFLVQYQYEESGNAEMTGAVSEQADAQIHRRYKCNEGCGFESETYYEICPKCMTSNSMVEISETKKDL